MKNVFTAAVLFFVVSPIAFSTRAQQAAAALQPQRAIAATTTGSSAPTAPAPSSAASIGSGMPSSIDPAKEADIRKLLELANTKAMLDQTIGTMMALIQKSLLQSNPDDPRSQMFANLVAQQLRGDMSSQYEDLVNHLVPVYDKYYTKDDIEQIIQFYGTPIGQKLLKVTPDLARESQTIGYQWGAKIGRDAFVKVLQQHPDLQSMASSAVGPK